MEQVSNASEFVEQLNQGLLDGRLNEELVKLSQGQPEVALLLAELVKRGKEAIPGAQIECTTYRT
jgi:hypothetical protein